MFPKIHLNGTSAEELITAIEEAQHAINVACIALVKTSPNMRDYPDFIRSLDSRVQSEGGFVEARDAVQADLTALHNILHRLTSVWANIDDQTTTQRLRMPQAKVDLLMAAYNDRRKK